MLKSEWRNSESKLPIELKKVCEGTKRDTPETTHAACRGEGFMPFSVYSRESSETG